MTIASEVQRIKDNIANTYTALGEKGATIPETQNSANLADTVATITTGGGGGNVRGNWVVPRAVLELEEACNTTEYDCQGIVIKNNIPTIYNLQIHNKCKVTISDGTVYTNDTSAVITIPSHTFDASKDIDGYRWIKIQSIMSPEYKYGILYNVMGYAYAGFITNSTDNGTSFSNRTGKYAIFVHINCDNRSATPGKEEKYAMLESFSIGPRGISGPNTRVVSFFPPYAPNENNKPLKYIPDANMLVNPELQRNPIDSHYDTYFTAENVPYGANYKNYKSYFGATMPLRFGSEGTDINTISKNSVLKEAYIILPSECNTVQFYNGVNLTLENWRYIAENAPITTENGALKMNDINYTACLAEGTIIPTLQSKGWTVSAT